MFDVIIVDSGIIISLLVPLSHHFCIFSLEVLSTNFLEAT